MRLENHTLDFPEQPVGQAGGRAKLLDKLLRQISHAFIAERPVGVRAIKGACFGVPSRPFHPYLCVTHKWASANEEGGVRPFVGFPGIVRNRRWEERRGGNECVSTCRVR